MVLVAIDEGRVVAMVEVDPGAGGNPVRLNRAALLSIPHAARRRLRTWHKSDHGDDRLCFNPSHCGL